MDSDTVGRYLERIGARWPSAPDSVALRELQRRHLEAVPFENLSIHLGEAIVLTEDALVDKIVRRRRGGFCYELNGLFSLLLTALGFDVSLLGASMFRSDGTLSPAFDHLTLLVELDERYIVDVGSGHHALHPLRRDWPEAQVDPAGSFLVVDAPGGDVDVYMDGSPRYRAESRVRRLEDFARPCWWHATSPESHFHDVARCSRPTESGRVTIVGDRLLETLGGERVETVLTTDADLLATYEKHFGLKLSRAPTCSPPSGTSPRTGA